MIDGRRYETSCGAVRPDTVTTRRVAVGQFQGQATEVRTLAEVDSAVLMAVKLPGGLCGDEDKVPLSPWSMLLPEGANVDRQNAAICRVTVAQHLERNHCPAGG